MDGKQPGKLLDDIAGAYAVGHMNRQALAGPFVRDQQALEFLAVGAADGLCARPGDHQINLTDHRCKARDVHKGDVRKLLSDLLGGVFKAKARRHDQFKTLRCCLARTPQALTLF